MTSDHGPVTGGTLVELEANFNFTGWIGGRQVDVIGENESRTKIEVMYALTDAGHGRQTTTVTPQ